MAKVVRTAAMVVGAVALVATGIGAIGALAAGTALASATVAGISLGTIQAIGAIAGIAATLTARKPKLSGQGSQTQFMADPQAGIPYPIGRTAVAGNIVHQGAYGKDNRYQSFVIVWGGGGPHNGLTTFQVDRATVAFSGGAATGSYADYMWLDTQLGATPESSALTAPFAGFGGWGSSSKLSGYAAGLWTLRYDEKGKKFPNGVPKPLMIGEWALVYDPRLDDTYPGGSGDCRALEEDTYVWSENPWLHALTWALGRWQNGKRVLGVGIPVDAIDVASYVEAANIAETNSWTIGGVVYSTDDKWAAMKAMCQAGGGEPMRLGAKLSCFVNTPRVSLATITRDDLADGEISITAMQPRRDRINGVIPRYRSEAHDWEIVSASPVRVNDYVTEDGGERTREIDYPLVQDVNQAAKLAMYEVVNAREFGPINLPLKPFWVTYKPGDCLTVDIEECGLIDQDILVMGRGFDPATGVVSQTSRSETSSKHAFALGQTGTAPPTPSLSAPTDDPRYLLTEDAKMTLIQTSTQVGLTVSVTSSTITLSPHDRRYNDKVVAVNGGRVEGLDPETWYDFYYDDEDRSGALANLVPVTITTPTPTKMTVGADFLEKTTSDGAWDAAVRSTESGRYLKFKVPQDNEYFMLGLAASPAASLDFTGTNIFLAYMRGDARIFVYRDGVSEGVDETYEPGDYMTVEHEDDGVSASVSIYRNDDTLIWSEAVSTGLTLYMKGTANTVGARAEEIVFGPSRPGVIYHAVERGDPDDYLTAFASPDHPYRHYAGYARTADAGGSGGGGGGALPPGGGGSNPYENIP